MSTPDNQTSSASSATPTAPTKAPTRHFFARCTENRVEDDHDGGIVLFQAIAGQTEELLGFNAVANFKHDTPMRDYPVSRDEKRARVFRVTLEEVEWTDVPAAPTPPAPGAITPAP